MLKNIKLDIKLLLIFILLIVFTFTLIRLGSIKVEALIANYGTSCLDNYSDCSTLNKVNFLEELQTGNINISGDEFSKNTLVDSIKTVYGEVQNESWCTFVDSRENAGCSVRDYNGPCNDEEILYYRGIYVDVPNAACDISEGSISQSFSDNSRGICLDYGGVQPNYHLTNNIIPFYVNGLSQASSELVVGGTGIQGSVMVARMCPSINGIDYIPSNAKLDPGILGFGDYNSWGCCPSGYQFVTQGDNFGVNPGAINAVAECCAIPEGTVKGGSNYPYYLDNEVCKDRNGVTLWQNESEVNSDTGLQFSFTDTAGNIYGRALGYTVNPGQKGRGVDSSIQLLDSVGSKMSCPENTKCAVINAPDEQGSSNIITDSQNNTYTVINSETLKDEGADSFECQSCYTSGEPMIVTKSDLVFCSSGTALTESKPLINNNINDTIAYYTTDITNAAFIKQCRAQGGLPTAIGCLDTTPIGIITGLIRIALGVMGGVALVQLILVGINYQRGNEAEIKKAREQLVATLTGLALLVFSVLILRIIGVNVLDILPAGTF